MQKDIKLNVDVTTEPAVFKTIHMPFNVWQRQFERLKTLSEAEKQQLTDTLGYPINDLLSLESSSLIKSLLDPKDSLTPKLQICIHSHRLREVLKKCDDNNDLFQFLQLLINIETCSTGAKNGITHSHLYMNHGRILDEAIIGEQSFKEEISHFFKEELRRLREISLSDVLKKGLGLEDNVHDLYYLRGVLGGELGLLQQGEIPLLDMNANGVSQKLREKFKQELLDMFYRFYKLEDVLNRIHHLINNGAIQVVNNLKPSSSSTSTPSTKPDNLTLGIISEYLREEAWAYDKKVDQEKFDSKFVVLGVDGKPIGFTPQAVQKLLLQMGIFIQ